MIELFLALTLLGYTIIYSAKVILSEKTFNKIIYHSKVTSAITQIISLIAILTIIFGLITFLSVIILTIINLDAYQETLIDLEFEEKPVMGFLTVIGIIVLIYFPFLTLRFFPIYGGKKK